MTHLRSIRPFVVAITLSAALLGVRATMPTVFAECGNQNSHGGCGKAAEPNEAPQSGVSPSWWSDLVALFGSLLPTVGE